ncbi:MAG: DUF937 domain-containing protein [Pseudomonadota bacterium]
MNLMDAIMDQLDEKAIGKLAGGLGIDAGNAQQAVTAALPTILAGLQRNVAASSDGASALDRALDKHDGSVLGQLGDLLGGGSSSDGSAILGHIFGGKRERVEKGVSSAAGIDSSTAGQLLSTLAPLVMGALGKAKRESGLGASDLGGLLEREQENVRSRQPEASGMIGMLLDADGDGDVDFSDIASRGAGLLGGLFKR